MSISLPGRLRIKRIHGSNGPFCVGDLETEIGEFRVKDAVLEQFDEGLYEGQFWIQSIYPWSYLAAGRMVIEIRAKLADLQIDTERGAGEAREPQEPDPATEQASPAPSSREPAARPRERASTKPASERKRLSAPPAPKAAVPAVPPGNAEDHDLNQSDQGVSEADRALFGDELHPLVAAREPVKLDPTIDRLQFRAQRVRLKEGLDYAFKSATQTWYPPGHAERP